MAYLECLVYNSMTEILVEQKDTIMIDFRPITIDNKELYQKYLLDGKERSCEYSFANLYLWGQQNATILHGHMALFSKFGQKCIYPYPVGNGDKKAILDAIIADAKERGILCRITSFDEEGKQTLENLYPGRFQFHYDLGNSNYVYSIDDLADLPGSKYHKKRNHCNHFRTEYPDYSVEPLSEANLLLVKDMVEDWYREKLMDDPQGDYLEEQAAINKAFGNLDALDMEGLVLFAGNEVMAVTLGSRLSDDTFDVHFEKAKGDINGAYSVINQEFAKYIRNKYPDVHFLNREDDLGIEGLRIAKQRYFPHHMKESYWADYLEETLV